MKVSRTKGSIWFLVNSDDRTLRDHGLILRVRQIGDKRVQTIKSLSEGCYTFERSEWEQLIPGDQPDLTDVEHTPLAPVLTDDVRDTLKPVFETQNRATACSSEQRPHRHSYGGAVSVQMTGCSLILVSNTGFRVSRTSSVRTGGERMYCTSVSAG